MKFGIQLWSVRDCLKDNFYKTLQTLSEIEGIQGVEFAFYYGELHPDKLADMLKNFHWKTSGMFDKFINLTNPNSEIYAYAKALKCKYLISSFNEKMLKEDMDNCLSILNASCSVAATNGITVCYHGHTFDYVTNENDKCYIDKLMEIEALKLVPDTGWIAHAGKDVVAIMEKYAGRIPLIHLKDTKADNTITELGNGIIDFSKVLDFAAIHDVEWLNYEQDYFQTSPFVGCKTSFDYLMHIR